MRPAVLHTPDDRALSRPDLSSRRVGNVIHMDPRERARFQAFFRAAWAEWLRANFRNTEHVAASFGVRHSTACTWWNEDNRPTGDVVAAAEIIRPGFAAKLAADWQRRAA